MVSSQPQRISDSCLIDPVNYVKMYLKMYCVLPRTHTCQIKHILWCRLIKLLIDQRLLLLNTTSNLLLLRFLGKKKSSSTKPAQTIRALICYRYGKYICYQHLYLEQQQDILKHSSKKKPLKPKRNPKKQLISPQPFNICD